jgi:DNA adenine methylase
MMPGLEPLDLRYAGGKGLAGLQQWICAQQPPHVRYFEPFAGKAGVFRLKTPALSTMLMDRDDAIVDWLMAYVDRCRADRGHRQGGRGGAHVTVVQGDGIDWLHSIADECEADWLIYCDPPYLSTRSKLNLYRYEMSDADHRRFLRAACRLRCPVMISGYRCDLYMDRLAGWTLKTRWVITRGRTMADECLWSNAAASEAHAFGMTYDQLGQDYRQRERVAKLVKRWGQDFSKRPAIERRAILLALLNAEAGLTRENVATD